MEQHNDGGDEEEITQWMELQLVDAGKLNSKKWHHFIQVQRWVEQPSTEEAVRQKNRTKPDAEDCRTNGWGRSKRTQKDSVSHCDALLVTKKNGELNRAQRALPRCPGSWLAGR